VAALTPSGLTLDTGALIAADKDSAIMAALVKTAVQRRSPMTVPAPVLAQAWRKNNPKIALLLKACRITALDEGVARAVGNLLAEAGGSDIVDAAVVLGASSRGDSVVTSDREDIERLATALGTHLNIIAI
jgi:hypothetical protein